QQPWKIEDGVNPVGPASHESVEIAEGLFGPDVEPALGGKARGEFADHERRGDEEEERGKDPQADGGGTVVRGGGDPTRAEDGGDVEEQDVPEAHGAAQLLFRVG